MTAVSPTSSRRNVSSVSSEPRRSYEDALSPKARSQKKRSTDDENKFKSHCHKRQSYRRRSSVAYNEFCWGEALPASMADRLLNFLVIDEVVGPFCKSLNDLELEEVRQGFIQLMSGAFDGLDLRVVCVNLANVIPLFVALSEVFIDAIRRPHALGECMMVSAVNMLLQENDPRLESFLSSIKGHIVREVRGAMRDVVLERIAGRDHVSKAEAVEIWKEAICIRLDEDAMQWMLSFLRLEDLSNQEILSPMTVVQLLLSDKLEDLIYAASVSFDRKCVHFARVFANSPQSLANTGFYAWHKYSQTRSRRASIWKADHGTTTVSKDGLNGNMIINDQSFDQLVLDNHMVTEAQRVWRLFLASVDSPEAAGQAIFSAFFDSSESVQSLFTTPRAVQALRLLNSMEDLIMTMGDTTTLKEKVEVLGFQHLQFDVTIPRVAIFRDAFMHLLELELGDQVSAEAIQGLAALMNYAGGAFIYIRENYRERLELIQASWAAVNKGTEIITHKEEDNTETVNFSSIANKTPDKTHRERSVSNIKDARAASGNGATQRRKKQTVMQFIRGR